MKRIKTKGSLELGNGYGGNQALAFSEASLFNWTLSLATWGRLSHWHLISTPAGDRSYSLQLLEWPEASWFGLILGEGSS